MAISCIWKEGAMLYLVDEAQGVVHVGWSTGFLVTRQASQCWLCLDGWVDALPAEFSPHLKEEFSAAGRTGEV